MTKVPLCLACAICLFAVSTYHQPGQTKRNLFCFERIKMGTRNLTAVFSDGEYRVAQYGQWDGGPAGQGVICLEFLQSADLEKFKAQVNAIKFFTENEIEELDKLPSWEDVYPYISRNVAALVLHAIHYGELITSDIGPKTKVDIKKLVNRISFAGDSLFCEFAYVIDLDSGTFEIYRGFNKSELSSNERFYSFDKKYEEYHPVKLVKSYRLDSIPSEEQFISDLTENEEE